MTIDSAWLVSNTVCKLCQYPVTITQPDWENFPGNDYWWYCMNKKCVNHAGTHTGDMEEPDWVKDNIPNSTPKEKIFYLQATIEGLEYKLKEANKYLIYQQKQNEMSLSQDDK